MADRFIETTRTSYGSRVKSSLAGVIFGLLFIVGAFFLLWRNEGRAVRTANGLAEGAKLVLSVGRENVHPENEGKLIHISGPVTVTRPLTDSLFGITQEALSLTRKVEMYQWKEKSKTTRRETAGGGTEAETTYTYERTWADEPVSSASFKRPEGHTNPAEWRFKSQTWLAEDARLAAFHIPTRLVARMGDPLLIPMEPGKFSHQETPAPKVYQEKLYFGTDPASPQVGDQRLTFTRVMPGEYSFVAKQAGSTISPYTTRAGTELDMLEKGLVDAKAMFRRAVAQNTALTWALRVAGWFLMFIGINLFFRPLATLGRIIPFLGGLLDTGVTIFSAVLASIVSLVTIGLAWLAYHPALAITLLVLAAIIFLAAGMKYKKTAIG